MSSFYTIVAFNNDGYGDAIVDTNVNSNSHTSVRSYKTPNAAMQAIERGTKMFNVHYRVLGTFLMADGSVANAWMDEDKALPSYQN